MSVQRLILDIDGTLAEWKPVNSLDELFIKGHYENLRPNINVVKGIKLFMQRNPEIPVFVCSAILQGAEFSIQEKNNWVDNHLPEIPKDKRFFPYCGTDKSDSIPGGVGPEDYLMDDYTFNLDLWKGRGIKLLNGINHTKGTWKYDSVSMFNSPHDICFVIETIMNGGKHKDPVIRLKF